MIRHDGHDLRVFVLRGEVLGAIRRQAPHGEWRTNVSLGGKAEPCRPDAQTCQLALRAAQAIGAEMAGVDLMEDQDGGRMVVLEVNAVPGWRALATVTGIDVAADVLSALRDAAR
jgi:ribosomal protein S6--L-glutamate ligase